MGGAVGKRATAIHSCRVPEDCKEASAMHVLTHASRAHACDPSTYSVEVCGVHARHAPSDTLKSSRYWVAVVDDDDVSDWGKPRIGDSTLHCVGGRQSRCIRRLRPGFAVRILWAHNARQHGEGVKDVPPCGGGAVPGYVELCPQNSEASDFDVRRHGEC